MTQLDYEPLREIRTGRLSVNARSTIATASVALLCVVCLLSAATVEAGEWEEAEKLVGMGIEHMKAARYRDAIKCYEQALIVYENLGFREGEGWCLRNLGTAYTDLADYRKAIEYHTKALKISKEIPNRESESQGLGNLGNAYLQLADHEKAIEYYQRALAIAEEIGDRSGKGIWLGNLGIAYSDLADYRKAIEYYQWALAIAEETDDRRAKGSLLGNLGNAHSNLGDYRKAIDYYQEALAIAEEPDDKSGKGIRLGNLGIAYSDLADYRKAIEYYQRALAIAEETDDRRAKGIWLGNLGIAHSDLGNYRRAIDYYQKALAIAEEIDDKSSKGVWLGNLGIAYRDLADYRKAIGYYQKALAIAEEIDDEKGRGIWLGNLGAAYSDLADYPNALEYCDRAVSLCRDIGVPYGNHEGNIGDVYLATDRDDEAFAIYSRHSHPIRLGRYYLKNRRYGNARIQFTSHQDSLKEKQRVEFLLPSYIGEGLSDEGLDDFRRSCGAFEKAASLLERQRDCLPQEQRGRFLAGSEFHFARIEPYEGLVRTSLKLGNTGQAFCWAENTRARVLAERLAAKEAEVRELRMPKELAEEQEKIALELRGNLKSQDAAFKADNQELLKQLEAKYPELKKKQQEFIDRLRRDHPEYAAVHYPKPVKAGQLPLARDEVLIEFEVTDPGAVVFVVYGGKVQKSFMIEKTRAELESLVNEFRAPFEGGHEFEEFDNALARQLYDLLLKEALTGIHPSKKLIVVPDECLSLLPFEALVVELKGSQTAAPPTTAQQVATRGLVTKKEIIAALTKEPVRTRGLSVELPRIGIPIEFDTNSAKIGQKAEAQMKEIVAALASPRLKEAQFRVEGHTDSVGDEDHNLTLSLRRAGSVVDYVVDKAKLKKDRFFTEGLGESRPVASNDSDEGRQRNRRVEIVRLPDLETKTAGPRKATWKMPEDVVYLIDRYASISYYQAATVLANNRELKKPRVNEFDLFAVADPIFGGDDTRTSKLAQRSADRAAKGLTITPQQVIETAHEQGQTYCFNRLPCTAQEVQEVASLFPKRKTETLLGAKADEASLKGMALDKYRYVLFSTHGILGDELPYIREPALVLNLLGNEDEDGFLTMSEIMNLRLNADLVCLSACQTGLGTQQAGEGVMGLTRAFMYAGCDSLLVSLWSVADVSSALLMTEFFKGLKAGKDKSAALHDAKTHLRKHGYDHPFFWAPFVLVGER